MRDKLINEMKKIFGNDDKRINHALAVLSYADRIKSEEAGDDFIVEAAAILHDIGIQAAEQKYGSSTGKYQEIEGPPIAEEILKRHNIASDAVEHICKIIANHHSGRNIDTDEFRIIWDADWLVNLQADFTDLSNEKKREMAEKVFKTGKGREIALGLFSKN
jgi:HD superfamily phosphodiesterase